MTYILKIVGTLLVVILPAAVLAAGGVEDGVSNYAATQIAALKDAKKRASPLEKVKVSARDRWFSKAVDEIAQLRSDVDIHESKLRQLRDELKEVTVSDSLLEVRHERARAAGEAAATAMSKRAAEMTAQDLQRLQEVADAELALWQTQVARLRSAEVSDEIADEMSELSGLEVKLQAALYDYGLASQLFGVDDPPNRELLDRTNEASTRLTVIAQKFDDRGKDIAKLEREPKSAPESTLRELNSVVDKNEKITALARKDNVRRDASLGDLATEVARLRKEISDNKKEIAEAEKRVRQIGDTNARLRNNAEDLASLAAKGAKEFPKAATRSTWQRAKTAGSLALKYGLKQAEQWQVAIDEADRVDLQDRISYLESKNTQLQRSAAQAALVYAIGVQLNRAQEQAQSNIYRLGVPATSAKVYISKVERVARSHSSKANAQSDSRGPDDRPGLPGPGERAGSSGGRDAAEGRGDSGGGSERSGGRESFGDVRVGPKDGGSMRSEGGFEGHERDDRITPGGS